ncbi:TRAP transporter permease [Hydrogenophaga sp.]|uniref:TRAP transporter permease n=1 Tax=Hydrogenophaga sp. TaxID=1904254 RepID=UPI003564BB09
MNSSISTGSASELPLGAQPEPRLHGTAKWIWLALGTVGMVLAINQTFNLSLLGFLPLGNSYLYYLIGIFLAAAFISIPAGASAGSRVPWYDWLLCVAVLCASLYLGLNGLTIIEQGWDYSAPLPATVAAGVMLVMVLEGVRRAGGWLLLGVALLFGAYPLFADHMPGFLWGTQYSFGETIRAHVMGVESIIGIPMQVVAQLVIGFVVFGAALTATGGGEFFMQFATALMGRSRGGPAKVAVLSSAILGSLSGSVITNILTSGPITIPTMKRTGYPAHYAAAIEACASTGGTLMPPVMGAVAFIMASFLGVPYSEIIIAAFLPALLFYLALLFQVDIYAAARGLKGLPESEIPKLWDTLKVGWPYLLSLGMLIYMLLFMRLEAYAPYYAALVLLGISVFKRTHRLNLKRAITFLTDLTGSLANLVAILAGIGLVVGGLSYTGVAGAFSRELLLYANGSVPLMLAAGAITSFVLGMGMTVSACYIFLSILLAPALISAGLNPLASHLFILYWGMMSYLTPPVALAAITAAGISGSSPVKTGFYAMRLGAILFILPFLFVIEPALILQGPWQGIASASLTAVIAIWVLSSAMEGYLYRVGALAWPLRALVLLAGIALIYPERFSDMIGLAIIALIYLVNWLRGGRRQPTQNAGAPANLAGKGQEP